jgi:hypothetical protein
MPVLLIAEADLSEEAYAEIADKGDASHTRSQGQYLNGARTIQLYPAVSGEMSEDSC